MLWVMFDVCVCVFVNNHLYKGGDNYNGFWKDAKI